ncbi:ATP-dependent DNA helicase srs2 [Savitreella phatthalungensis]
MPDDSTSPERPSAEDWLGCLNEEQRACVEHDADVLQILAGPGSGKTRVLTTRIAYTVLQRHIPPEHIVVVTFTNKAARELKERLACILGATASKRLIVGTFHSVALRYLQRYGSSLPDLPDRILVADTGDSRNVVAKVLRASRKNTNADTEEGRQLSPSAVLAHISSLKSRCVTVDRLRVSVNAKDCPLKLSSTSREEVLRVYEAYQAHLRDHGLLDFDDLMVEGIRLFQEQPQILDRVACVFVDEFQDTSKQQYELMRLLARSAGRLTVVGDHDQSIYGFRAADIENFLRMHKTYPHCVELHLKLNYRSSGAIVFAAASLIEQDCARPAKSLEAKNSIGAQPVFRKLETAQSEADWLACEIQRVLGASRGLLDENDIAILVRSASLTLPIEQALQRASIRYRMVNARKFLERPHIRTLIAYLRVVQDSKSPSLLQIINVPARKFGDTSLDALQAEASRRGCTPWQVLRQVARGRCQLGKKRDAKLEVRLAKLVAAIEKAQSLQHAGMADLITALIDDIAYVDHLKHAYPEDWKDRIDDVEQFKATADVLAAESEDLTFDGIMPEESPLDRLMNALSLMSDSGDGSESSNALPQVSISTIHSAKGLEWGCVFVPGCYEGSLPSSRAVEDGELDEERRLLYVGMTRAKALLYLSYPRRSARQADVSASQFLEHSAMKPLFTDRGPRFDVHWLIESASILGRSCPSTRDHNIIASSHIDDNYNDRPASVLADESYDARVLSRWRAERTLSGASIDSSVNASSSFTPVSATEAQATWRSARSWHTGQTTTMMQLVSSSAQAVDSAVGFASARRVLDSLTDEQIQAQQARDAQRYAPKAVRPNSSQKRPKISATSQPEKTITKPSRTLDSFFVASTRPQTKRSTNSLDPLPRLPTASAPSTAPERPLPGLQRSETVAVQDDYRHVILSSSPERPPPLPRPSQHLPGGNYQAMSVKSELPNPPPRKKRLGARIPMSMTL